MSGKRYCSWNSGFGLNSRGPGGSLQLAPGATTASNRQKITNAKKTSSGVNTPPEPAWFSAAISLLAAFSFVVLVGNSLPGRGVENQTFVGRVIEIKHVEERAGELIKRSVANLRQRPVLFDEANHRALIGEGAVHVVRFGEGRHDQQRQTRAVAATTLNSFQGVRAVTAGTGAGQSVLRGVRLIQDRAHGVIVPTVGVVVCNDYGGGIPIRQTLQEVDDGCDENLFIQR